MNATRSSPGKRLIVPEVIQTSSMDCGPATLSALLSGFRINVSYGRLREACQTDVDGTSIDRLEEIAQKLGLDAEQVIIPREHIFLDFAENLPAIVVIRRPTGAPHFLVCWRRHGSFVQIMDPATGRRFVRTARFLEDLFIHSQRVSVAELKDWLGQEGFQRPLLLRLRRLGFGQDAAEALVAGARAEGGWRRWARLDAAARMVASLVESGAIGRGGEARRLLEALAASPDAEADIPPTHWSMVPADPRTPAGPAGDDEEAEADEQVIVRGAVLVVVHGKLQEDSAQTAARLASLPTDLRAALAEPAERPLRALLSLLPGREHGVIALGAVAALAAAGLQVGLDALFRGTLHLAFYTRNPLHRLSAFVIGALLVAGISGLVLLLSLNAARLGRYIELRLRTLLFAKLPQLNDRYFHSRPVSDMAERAHSLWRVRQFLSAGVDGLRVIGTSTLVALALVYFLPRQRLLVLALLAMAIGMPLLIQPLFVGLDLRVRTYTGALIKAFLDALVGLSPVRTHAGERAFSRLYEELLVGWARARLSALQLHVFTQALRLLVSYAIVCWLVARYIGDGGSAAGLLLLYYWAIGLPAAGSELSQTLQLYPDIRNVTVRMLEPLGAPEQGIKVAEEPAPQKSGALSLSLQGVSVIVAGRRILHDVSLDIPAGMHVAFVGASGAGKSTLVGLLLGFHKVAAGRVLLDGSQAELEDFLRLRPGVAWVDPDIRLWNRSLFDNLYNGHPEDRADALSHALTTADLLRVTARLSAGLATPLGEGGRLLSGGEGQRVRLGRALLQGPPRLVLLDEPFRGLDRGQRHELLARVRSAFDGTTVLYISHDIASTLSFPKVAVLEEGRIVEMGAPEALRQDPGSRYSAMLKAEEAVRRDLWTGAGWQRLRMVDGRLVVEQESETASESH